MDSTNADIADDPAQRLITRPIDTTSAWPLRRMVLTVLPTRLLATSSLKMVFRNSRIWSLTWSIVPAGKYQPDDVTDHAEQRQQQRGGGQRAPERGLRAHPEQRIAPGLAQRARRDLAPTVPHLRYRDQHGPGDVLVPGDRLRAVGRQRVRRPVDRHGGVGVRRRTRRRGRWPATAWVTPLTAGAGSSDWRRVAGSGIGRLGGRRVRWAAGPAGGSRRVGSSNGGRGLLTLRACPDRPRSGTATQRETRPQYRTRRRPHVARWHRAIGQPSSRRIRLAPVGSDGTRPVTAHGHCCSAVPARGPC